MPTTIYDNTQVIAQQVLTAPSYFLSMFSRLISNLIFGNDNQKYGNIDFDDLDPDDRTHIFVNADNARSKVPTVNDPAHIVTIVMKALENNLESKYAPEHQFLIDFMRASQVVDNGTELAKNLPEQALARWSSEVARNNNLPVEAIRAAICVLNQNIGNAAVQLLYNLQGSLDGQPLIYRTLSRSSLMRHILKRDGDKLSIYYSIPIQAVDPSISIDENFNEEMPDIILHSSLTINFSNYFAYKAPGEINSASTGNPDVVTNVTTLQQCNPALTFSLDQYKSYIDAEWEGFLLLAPDPESEIEFARNKI